MSDDVLNVIERRITDLSGKIRNQERKQHLLVVIKDLKQVSDALRHCYAECEDRIVTYVWLRSYWEKQCTHGNYHWCQAGNYLTKEQ